jgi:hypothetical protein
MLSFSNALRILRLLGCAVCVLLCACAPAATRGDIAGSGLIGVWRLSTWKGQPVAEMASADEEHPAEVNGNDLTVKADGGLLVFGGMTGEAYISELQKDGKVVTLKGYYDGRPHGDVMRRSTYVAHFVNADEVFFTQEPSDGQPSIPDFFWPGPDAVYKRVQP